jgi:glutathione synthase
MYLQSTANDLQAHDSRCCGPQVCFYCFPLDHLETDQRIVESELCKLGVKCFFAHLGANIELKGGDLARAGVGGTLIIDGIEASVVYFHCTYDPGHFADPKEWQNRKLIELSRASKAPTLLGHLAGLKKVQQVLSNRDELGRFLSPEEVEGCVSVFARQVDPSRPDSEPVVAAAKREPENWVLKPQREGGGNNFYGEELRRILCEDSCLSQYVLMERIKPQPMPSLLMKKAGVVEQHDVCSELGLFSAYFASGNEEIHNNVGGAMLRTKAFSSAEGGVCAGHGVIDTPFVVP